ncbi:hypothetical protein EJB05_35188, partial [Eragrostis curvula]
MARRAAASGAGPAREVRGGGWICSGEAAWEAQGGRQSREASPSTAFAVAALLLLSRHREQAVLHQHDIQRAGRSCRPGLCFLKQLLILRATAILYKQGKSEFAGSAIVKLEGTKGIEKELSRAEFWLRLRLCVVSLEESCKHNLQTVLLAS